jgi:hypothetical protein
MTRRLPRASPFLLSAVTFAFAAAPARSWAAGSTLVVDLGTTVRPVTHVGSGGLYALRDATTPAASPWVSPLHLNQLVQPPPGAQQLPNGSPVPVGDVLKVDPTAVATGAHVTVRMPDIYPNFPYRWVSWDDWLGRIGTMVNAVLQANAKGPTNIDGWELWNEPDWTWDTTNAGAYLAGWTRTYQTVRALDAKTPIVGPSYSHWDAAAMRSFLTNAQTTNAMPDVVCWHELSGWAQVTGDVQAYRALETQLGISPRPISIDEYAETTEVDVPAAANHYVAQFERTGVRDGERAFWFESGTINGLLFNGMPTGTYWLYRWYGDQTGDVVSVTPTPNNDGVAAYDATRRTLILVFGGDSGTNAVTLRGVGAIDSTVTVTLSHATSTGRMANLAAPAVLSTADYVVQGGAITVSVPNQEASGAYELVVTAKGGIGDAGADSSAGPKADASADGAGGAGASTSGSSSGAGGTSGSGSGGASSAGSSSTVAVGGGSVSSSGSSAGGSSDGAAGAGGAGSNAGCGCAAAGLPSAHAAPANLLRGASREHEEWGAIGACAALAAAARGRRSRAGKKSLGSRRAGATS